MYEVVVVAMHGLVPSDLATPCDLFNQVRQADGKKGYRVRVCGEAREVRGHAFNLKVAWTLAEVAAAHTVIVPGLLDPDLPISAPVISAVRAAARNGARIASVCTGAFVLAAAGLLDGLRATTHWQAAPLLATRYPRITVDANVLFVEHGQLVTSAGASAGLDMCLHLVRRDYGQAVAAQVARLAVAPLHREGGQAQFIRQPPQVSDTSLAPLLAWMQQHATQPLTLAALARQAKMSARTLSRRFKEQVGVSPLQWLLSARSRRAQELLETTALSVEEVAAQAGFDGTSTFRERFRRDVGVSPSRYRQTFNATPRRAS